MPVAMDFLDVEAFIEEVRKHPGIWDVTCQDYHNKQKKRSAWLEVCEALNEDFPQKSEMEQEAISELYMKRWKGLRDTYIKSERKNSSPGRTRRYIYARQLDFLFKNTESAHSVKSIDGPEDESGNNEDFALASPVDPTAPYTKPSSTGTTKKKRREAFEKNSVNLVQEQVLEPSDEADDDRSFFESLLPAVKTLRLDSKLDFRYEVLGLLKRFRSSTDGSQPQQKSRRK